MPSEPSRAPSPPLPPTASEPGRITDESPLRLGSRASPLALAQAGQVADLLTARTGRAAMVLPFTTTGDRWQAGPLAEIGGKGLFTKELEDALLAGVIDLAVHSMKDMPTRLPPGLIIAAVPARADPRDVWIGPPPETLPAGARIGTSSLRRRAQVRARWPHLSVGPLRGNIGTRLQRITEGTIAATLLASAGMQRLGLNLTCPHHMMDTGQMLPAVGQGALALEIRADDRAVRALVELLACEESTLAVTAERTMLGALDGSCRTPIAGLAQMIAPGRLRLTGRFADPEGAWLIEAAAEGAADRPEALGLQVADALLAAIPASVSQL